MIVYALIIAVAISGFLTGVLVTNSKWNRRNVQKRVSQFRAKSGRVV